MKACFSTLISLPFIIFAQQSQDSMNYEHKTPAQIQLELDQDEALFKRAKEMFNPWYTGPLLTPSPSMTPVGYGSIQPYIFLYDTHAAYNEDRRSVRLPHSKFNLNPSISSLQFGVTPTMDIAWSFGGNVLWQDDRSGGGLSDMSIVLGWPIWRQSLFVPGIKFTITETFPTGNYQRLNTNGLGLSAVGGGSWQTRFGLALSKLFFWTYKHPFNTRLFFGYQVACPVKVHGFNAYGGGFGTKGTVHPGNTFSADLGLELSLSQQWVIATDLTYSATNETTFSGHSGTTTKGGTTPASIGGGYSDQITIAPAIEYNWSPNLGVIGGLQFSVYGRNSSNFVAGSFSVSYSFGPI